MKETIKNIENKEVEVLSVEDENFSNLEEELPTVLSEKDIDALLFEVDEY